MGLCGFCALLANYGHVCEHVSKLRKVFGLASRLDRIRESTRHLDGIDDSAVIKYFLEQLMIIKSLVSQLFL